MPQRAARRPFAVRRPFARRELDLVDVSFFATVPSENLAVERLRIDTAYPRHPKRTCFDRDPACFPEQLGSIAHTDNERIDLAKHCIYASQALDSHFRTLLHGHVLADTCDPHHCAGARAQHGIIPAD